MTALSNYVYFYCYLQQLNLKNMMFYRNVVFSQYYVIFAKLIDHLKKTITGVFSKKVELKVRQVSVPSTILHIIQKLQVGYF